MITLRVLILIVLAVVMAPAVVSQDAQKPLTNTDIEKLESSGVGNQTILLMIQKNRTNFDTSSEAIIALKKAGVSDAVLNAMIGAPTSSAVVPPSPSPSIGSVANCAKSLDDVLASVGSHDVLARVYALRYTAKETVNNGGRVTSATLNRLEVFPTDFYITVQLEKGPGATIVYTPDFNYMDEGKMRTSVPAAAVQDIVTDTKLNPTYVAQHRSSYSCAVEGTEQINGIAATKLRIAGDAVEGFWFVDPSNEHLMRLAFTASDASQSVTDYSNWQSVDGVLLAFNRHGVKGGVTTDLVVEKLEVNPSVDPALFRPPTSQPDASITLKVLQSESVPYVVQTNGGISTACSISGSTNTTMTASTYGNTTYGTATSTPNMQMNCQTHDNTIQ